LSASATAFAGSCQISTPFSTSVPPILRADSSTPDSGAINCASTSSASGALRSRGSNGIAGGPSAAASVIDSITRTRAMPSA
jgi:hypothetical protein